MTLKTNQLYGFGGTSGPSKEIHISENTTTFDLSATMITLGLNPSASYTIDLYVDEGVIVGSALVTVAGLNLNIPDSKLKINLFNYGYIVGRGGNGGSAATNGYGGPGTPGGHAIETTIPLTLYNYGIIGGGGGGGSGSGNENPGGETYDDPGGAGGGGAGYIAGSGGSGGQPGSPGSLLTGGSGGRNQSGDGDGWGGYAGSGGALGMPGTSGARGGTPGAAGRAIIGSMYMTWKVQGDIRGTVV